MHNLFLRLSVLAASFLVVPLSSCMTFDHHEQVIERSQPDVPKWILENGKPSEQNSQQITLVYQRADVLNLPLGIKQTQSASLWKAKSLVMKQVEQNVMNEYYAVYEDAKKPVEPLAALLTDALDKSRQETDFKPIRPQSVYWELRQRLGKDGLENHYVIWVLLLVDKDDYNRALTLTAQSLASSKNEQAVAVGKSILARSHAR